MRENIQQLNEKDISSEVFIIAPSQIDMISKIFGDKMALAMNVKPLASKIQQLAADVLIQTLRESKTMGEQKH